jgi:hypothetical protein
MGCELARKMEPLWVMIAQTSSGSLLRRRLMKTGFMHLAVYSESAHAEVRHRHQMERVNVIEEAEKMGMTPTPAANASPAGKRRVPGNETGAIPALAPVGAAGRRTENDYERETELCGIGKAD